MDIFIISSVGTGKTILSAFDNALVKAGVNNYNLILLSSVIPPNSIIKKVHTYELQNKNEFGHKLYVVQAKSVSSTPKKIVGACVGWYQLNDNRGFFVEHHIIGDDLNLVEENLKKLTINSLNDLLQSRNLNFDLNKIKMKLSVIEVKKEPTCALVTAVYKSEGWKQNNEI